ncbi:MAG TPA: MATE family efflux transporter [Candidatus Alectryocaccobium stercorigallinarum]|nr:MATE family efflux transporter [Candidatus Alectryocaccobium stercorigallinarum]
MSNAVNMTTGNPARLIFRLAVPLMLTNIGQQLYGIVDAIVVGRGVGVDAFAALGACDWLVWAILWAVQALAQGFSSLIAQRFGAGKEKDMRHAFGMCVWLCLIFGASITIVFVILARPLLTALGTPADIIDGATSYLTIIYGGTLIVIFYNMCAATLRAVGDGKTPLIAMAVAGGTNVVLDLIFVMIFKWGIEGAAAATLTGQAVAVILCLIVLKRSPLFKMERSDWRWDIPMAKEMCGLGIPLALSSTIVVIGGILAQAVINSAGTVFVAGCTAANKLHGTLDTSAVAIGFASSTFIGQNYGAGKIGRVREGIKKATIIAIAVGAAITIAMFIFGRPIVGMFLDRSVENAELALEYAYQYVMIMSAMLIGAYLMNLYRYSLQGLGNTVAPMFSGFFELGARLFVAYVFPIFLGNFGLFFMDGSAWWAAGIFQIVCFYKTLKEREKEVSRS